MGNFARAIETLAQAGELLKIFKAREWQDSGAQKDNAGLLGKWVSDRSLRVFCEATGRSIPDCSTLMELGEICENFLWNHRGKPSLWLTVRWDRRCRKRQGGKRTMISHFA